MKADYFRFAGLEVPADAKLGDTWPVSGTAKIVGMETGLLDVTSFGGPEEHVEGVTSYTVFVILERSGP